jgi:hypothetical protein
MKCIFATFMLCCLAITGFSQTTFSSARGFQSQKNNLPPGASGKNYLTTAGVNCGSKGSAHNNANNYKPDVSVISIIPTLRLWLLPVNLPNPFMKDED